MKSYCYWFLCWKSDKYGCNDKCNFSFLLPDDFKFQKVAFICFKKVMYLTRQFNENVTHKKIIFVLINSNRMFGSKIDASLFHTPPSNTRHTKLIHKLFNAPSVC